MKKIKQIAFGSGISLYIAFVLLLFLFLFGKVGFVMSDFPHKDSNTTLADVREKIENDESNLSLLYTNACEGKNECTEMIYKIFVNGEYNQCQLRIDIDDAGNVATIDVYSEQEDEIGDTKVNHELYVTALTVANDISSSAVNEQSFSRLLSNVETKIPISKTVYAEIHPTKNNQPVYEFTGEFD